DVGPVIDESARAALEAYVESIHDAALRCYRVKLPSYCAHGTFVAPTLVVLDRLSRLTREVFGPVLHVTTFRSGELDALVDAINGLGYGLTLGVHSRIDATIARIVERARVGNLYVNRNMIGAVVGVQPFGGEGLSGTGPKAGGPLYLHRFLARTPDDSALRELRALDGGVKPRVERAFDAFATWASSEMPELAALCARLRSIAPSGLAADLPGPTGERNTYSVVARERVL